MPSSIVKQQERKGQHTVNAFIIPMIIRPILWR